MKFQVWPSGYKEILISKLCSRFTAAQKCVFTFSWHNPEGLSFLLLFMLCHFIPLKWTTLCSAISIFRQALFSDQSLVSSEKIIATTQTAIFQEEVEDFDKPHTLMEYSIDHFLPPPKRTLSKALSSQVKRREKNVLWSFSKVTSSY